MEIIFISIGCGGTQYRFEEPVDDRICEKNIKESTRNEKRENMGNDKEMIHLFYTTYSL